MVNEKMYEGDEDMSVKNRAGVSCWDRDMDIPLWDSGGVLLWDRCGREDHFHL